MITGQVGEPLVHAGPAFGERVAMVPSPVVVIRGELTPGATITEALWALLEPTGALAAAAEFGTGTFGELPFVFPAVGDSEERPMSFSELQACPGPATVLSGSATVGMRFGERFTHTHATWLDANGTLRGGHLMPEATVGDVPIQVTMRALLGAQQISDTCPETGFPAFTPYPNDDSQPSRNAATSSPRAVISRVRPGVHLDEAVVQICREAGFEQASVRASLGSTVGAKLSTGDGQITEVAWPAVEFTQLVGSARDMLGSAPRVELAGTVVDIYGEVYNGVVRPGENPVAVTFELYVEERV